MPTWTSSLTTMLIDGAPIPLVAQITGAPPGSVATNESRPRLRASGRPPARCSVAISSERAGIAAEQRRSSCRRAGHRPRTRCGTAGPPSLRSTATQAVFDARRWRSTRSHDATCRRPLRRLWRTGRMNTLIPMSEQIPLVDYLVLGDDAAPGGQRVHLLRGPVLRPPQRLRRVLRHRLPAMSTWRPRAPSTRSRSSPSPRRASRCRSCRRSSTATARRCAAT